MVMVVVVVVVVVVGVGDDTAGNPHRAQIYKFVFRAESSY